MASPSVEPPWFGSGSARVPPSLPVGVVPTTLGLGLSAPPPVDGLAAVARALDGPVEGPFIEARARKRRSGPCSDPR